MKFAREMIQQGENVREVIVGVTPDNITEMKLVAFIQTEADKKQPDETIEDFILRKVTEFFVMWAKDSLEAMKGVCKICREKI